MERAAKLLLDWFYEHRRVLPFRQDPSPYHVWVSEIMLQQTRMSAAVPYYERFIAELPDPAALASCDAERLRKLWQGLGYYNRAANLQKAARLICERYGGELPADLEALRALPGVGDYTAGAVASIGFGIPAPAVDGNVLRVFARFYNDDADVTRPETKRLFTGRVMAMQPPEAPGDFNQALMELGALVCLPNGAPLCGGCPWAELCAGHAAGTAAALPVKPAKKPKPAFPVTVALVQSPAGVLLQKRPAGGLLAGLWQPLAFEGEALDESALRGRLAALGLTVGAMEPLPAARHVFTHKVWSLGGWRCTAQTVPAPQDCVWADQAALEGEYAVPSAFAAYLPVANQS
ncbi:MAG: A/G-specific adenine glycosylase [Gemmiger sp.]